MKLEDKNAKNITEKHQVHLQHNDDIHPFNLLIKNKVKF